MLLIGVAGMVGAGKSTLARALAQRFGLHLALESAGPENPWLDLYYGEGDESRRVYALRLQLHFLAARLESLRAIRARGGGWVLDRTWYEDAEIFARGLYEQGLMSAPEFGLYSRLYAELLHGAAARPPALLIYLHGPLDEIVRRIETRGHAGERETERAYWAALYERYERWIADFRRAPVLRLDVREYDLAADPGSLEDVAALVRQRLDRQLPQTELWPAAPRALGAPPRPRSATTPS